MSVPLDYVAGSFKSSSGSKDIDIHLSGDELQRQPERCSSILIAVHKYVLWFSIRISGRLLLL